MVLMNPLPSIINNPLRGAPYSSSNSSSTNTPYAYDIFFDISANRGILRFPTPPWTLGVFIQARCVKWESVEIPITSAPSALNLKTASENATNSVGQTYVKSKG